MKFSYFSKIFLVLIVPFLLTLLVLKFTIFGQSFYEDKFLEYEVGKKVNEPVSLHQKVINFINGESNSLPDEFNEREKSHLLDVKNVVSYLTIALYVLIAIFVFMLVFSIIILKVNNTATNFVGKIMIFGGILTVVLSVILFFLITSDFAGFFESFHQMFFDDGTYLFDPSSEVIVRLYPSNLFMDLGLNISRNIIIASIVVIAIGVFLLFKSKKTGK